MRETDQILGLWAECKEAGESAVLATVVQTRGSSYRLPGARLLITPRGRRAGSISGGCLEEDLIKRAWWLTEDNRGVIRRYDTSPDDDGAPAYGLGCNGIIDVLLERVTPSDPKALTLLESVRKTRRPAAISHVFPPHRHPVANPDIAMQLEVAAEAALASGVSCHVSFPQEGGPVEAFIEVLAPPVRLLLFGAGDDAIPVTELAHFLGWEVFVSDGRAHYARPERFPKANLVRVGKAGELATPVDAWTVAILMSHSYSQDLEALRVLAGAPLRYLGLLGPRKRTMQLIADAGLDGSCLAAPLHSPMGLDIGADGAQQVALSAIAEIQASLNGRLGGPLKQRPGSIHSPTEDESQVFTVRSILCA